jgi:hypothetical protein
MIRRQISSVKRSKPESAVPRAQIGAALFQKPHEFQAAKYLNLNARESQFRVNRK